MFQRQDSRICHVVVVVPSGKEGQARFQRFVFEAIAHASCARFLLSGELRVTQIPGGVWFSLKAVYMVLGLPYGFAFRWEPQFNHFVP